MRAKWKHKIIPRKFLSRILRKRLRASNIYRVNHYCTFIPFLSDYDIMAHNGKKFTKIPSVRLKYYKPIKLNMTFKKPAIYVKNKKKK